MLKFPKLKFPKLKYEHSAMYVVLAYDIYNNFVRKIECQKSITPSVKYSRLILTTLN